MATRRIGAVFEIDSAAEVVGFLPERGRWSVLLDEPGPDEFTDAVDCWVILAVDPGQD